MQVIDVGKNEFKSKEDMIRVVTNPNIIETIINCAYAQTEKYFIVYFGAELDDFYYSFKRLAFK